MERLGAVISILDILHNIVGFFDSFLRVRGQCIHLIGIDIWKTPPSLFSVYLDFERSLTFFLVNTRISRLHRYILAVASV